MLKLGYILMVPMGIFIMIGFIYGMMLVSEAVKGAVEHLRDGRPEEVYWGLFVLAVILFVVGAFLEGWM